MVDEFWAEISDSIQAIEEIYEDKLYPTEVFIKRRYTRINSTLQRYYIEEIYVDKIYPTEVL